MQVIEPRKLNGRWKIGGAAIALVVAAGLNACIGAAALAADVATPVPAYAKAPPIAHNDWTGFYVGAGIGTRSSQVDGDVTSALFATFGNSPDDFLASCGSSCKGESLNSVALRVSPYFGYNYQFAKQWLAGIEGDIGFGNKTATLTGMSNPNPAVSSFDGGDSFKVKSTWDASVRGRVGYLVTPTFLVYGTGGAAWQHIDAVSTCSTLPLSGDCGPDAFRPTLPSVITDSATKLGWTLGAGIETTLWSNWIVRGEYRYADFGTISLTDTRTGPLGADFTVSETLRLKTQTVTFGMAYKFD